MHRSISELIEENAVKKLKKTELSRSPGGTPMREVRKGMNLNMSDVISSALQRKFQVSFCAVALNCRIPADRVGKLEKTIRLRTRRICRLHEILKETMTGIS
jgi:hypothetical protein